LVGLVVVKRGGKGEEEVDEGTGDEAEEEEVEREEEGYTAEGLKVAEARW
jgi:hypothetical protein